MRRVAASTALEYFEPREIIPSGDAVVVLVEYAGPRDADGRPIAAA